MNAEFQPIALLNVDSVSPYKLRTRRKKRKSERQSFVKVRKESEISPLGLSRGNDSAILENARLK